MTNFLEIIDFFRINLLVYATLRYLWPWSHSDSEHSDSTRKTNKRILYVTAKKTTMKCINSCSLALILQWRCESESERSTELPVLRNIKRLPAKWYGREWGLPEETHKWCCWFQSWLLNERFFIAKYRIEYLQYILLGFVKSHSTLFTILSWENDFIYWHLQWNMQQHDLTIRQELHSVFL